MTKGLEIDFETRSDVDLKTRGVYIYMASPNTEALLARYQIDGGPQRAWRRGQPCPADIRAHVEAGGIVSAHNNAFERLLWQMILTPRFGWPVLRTEQCRCTAATAAAMALPRALGDLGAALGLSVQKDKEGMRLIRKFSIPRKPKKDEPPGLYWHEPEDHPDDFERFDVYCGIDVEVEAAADARMVPLSEYEQDLWIIDQRINDRGIRIDRTSANAAMGLADRAKTDLDKRMRTVTAGYVGKCSEVTKLVAWVQAQGVEMTSAAKAEIEELLEFDDLPENVRKAIEIRQEAAKTSVAKLKAFTDRAGTDGRIRGAFLFCAAGTGRWSSVGAQLHNLPRPRKIFGEAHLVLSDLFDFIRTGDPAVLLAKYGPELGKAMWLLSDAIRGFIWSAPGYDLLVADYSGIEGAVAAWFAGEEWKVDYLHLLQSEQGKDQPDLYRVAAAGIFNTTTDVITKKDDRRQVGKVSELSLQYQGGPGAFRSMARNYSLKLAPIYPIVWEAAGDERRAKAVKRYDNACARNEPITKLLNREEFLAAEIVKIGWRDKHPAITASWEALEDAAREAVEHPGRVVKVLKAAYLVSKGFLWCRLPSGRCLAYGSPKIKEQVWVKIKLEDGTWSEVTETMGREEAHRTALAGKVKIERQAKSAVTALGVNSVTKKWERFALYGGLVFENCLSGKSEVLTPSGWLAITNLRPTDLLWDGLEWVSHAGVVCNGVRETINFGQLRLTPDHKVWTNAGWIAAGDATLHAAETASPDPEYDWRALRPSGSDRLRRWGREKELVDGPMRLRHQEVTRRLGAPERRSTELWLPKGQPPVGSGEDTRYVTTQGLWGVAKHARPLSFAFALCVRALWGKRNYGLRALAEIRKLLAGYGPDLAARVDDRAQRQPRRLQPAELCLGGSAPAGAQHPIEYIHSNTFRPHADLRSGRDVRIEHDDPLLPSRGGVAGEAHAGPTRQQSPDHELVYDVLNAGPRHRFTVRGPGGNPIIVSNCVQAIARDLLANGIKKAEAAGYPVIAHVHDEIITEVPRGFGDVKEFEELICELPDWAAGLPLTASGWRGKRYRKD